MRRHSSSSLAHSMSFAALDTSTSTNTDRLDTAQFPDAQVASAAKVDSYVASLVEGCSSDTYIIVSQPGASIADFSQQSTPHLRRKLSGGDQQTKSTVTVSNVLGSVSSKDMLSGLKKQCKSYNHVSVDVEGTLIRSTRACFTRRTMLNPSFQLALSQTGRRRPMPSRSTSRACHPAKLTEPLRSPSLVCRRTSFLPDYPY